MIFGGSARTLFSLFHSHHSKFLSKNNMIVAESMKMVLVPFTSCERSPCSRDIGDMKNGEALFLDRILRG